MKKYLLYFVALLFSSVAFSQTGINTHNPQATLDVTGEPTSATVTDGVIAPRITGDQLEAKTVYTAAQTGAIVYVTSPISSSPSSNPQTVDVTATGYYYFNGTKWVRMAGSSSPSIYEAEGTGTWSLLNLSLGGTGNAQKINLTQLTPKFGASNIDADGDYVAPSSGYYTVKFEWRPTASGLNAGLLGNPYLLLSVNGNTTLAQKNFSAITLSLDLNGVLSGLVGTVNGLVGTVGDLLNILTGVPLLGSVLDPLLSALLPDLPSPAGTIPTLTVANVPINSTTLTYVVHLTKGDQLNFGVNGSSPVTLGLLKQATVSVYVYKISN